MRPSRCDLCHIDLDRVSVRRGGQVLLQDVSMHIHCGQLTVLIGQNGAGKTTLIRALLGEIPHGGSIRHLDSAGRDLAHLTTGYVPQHLSFDPEMPLTVMDFLASSMTRRPVWTGVGSRVRSQVLQNLKDVSAGDLADRPLGRCSGGELQRVLLALALHPAPDLLVLDEPVSGVDRNGLKLFLDTVTRLKERKHIAILLVSHDLRLVREYADHVILLDKNVLAQGPAEDVFSSAAFDTVFGAGAREDADVSALPGEPSSFSAFFSGRGNADGNRIPGHDVHAAAGLAAEKQTDVSSSVPDAPSNTEGSPTGPAKVQKPEPAPSVPAEEKPVSASRIVRLTSRRGAPKDTGFTESSLSGKEEQD